MDVYQDWYGPRHYRPLCHYILYKVNFTRYQHYYSVKVDYMTLRESNFKRLFGLLIWNVLSNCFRVCTVCAFEWVGEWLAQIRVSIFLFNCQKTYIEMLVEVDKQQQDVKNSE